MNKDCSSDGEWQRLKLDAEHALRVLLSELSDHESPQPLFEAYTYAKDITARAIQSRMLEHLPTENQQFRLLHEKIRKEMHARYRGKVPANLLSTPYSGKTHENLFSLLQENLTQPVPAAMLRIATGDNVHTERRARELRELGLDLNWYEIEEISVYELRSLKLDFDMIPAIVRNNTRRTKAFSEGEKRRILREAGIPDNG
ncbi:hypothetical protein ACFYW1_19525 [Streptomyces sp. NPDC002669]|uniref:hypothetical protein n=1 Tax=Streptomyces sp. NPDC002669 TaxID=3364658 RepID=UPI0036A53EB6